MLVAVGRRPQVDGIGLNEAMVAHDQGGIGVDKNLRTSQKTIYAAGDCTGGY